MLDSGASISVAGLKVLKVLGIRKEDLLQTKLTVTSADSSKMTILGVVLLEFRHPDTKEIVPELVYICEGTKTNLLSFGACVALGYMSPNMSTVSNPEACITTQTKTDQTEPVCTAKKMIEGARCREKIEVDLGTTLPGGVRRGKVGDCPCDCPLRSLPPDPPDEMPYEPKVENVKKLEAWILERYKSSAFNVCECQPLPTMHGDPL